MSQTVTSSFAAQNLAGAKGLDFAFVIAGWPAVYTVSKDSYAFAGDLASFSTAHAWANIPEAVGARVKDRPEEGGLTIGQLDVSVLDRVSGGVRQLTDLLAREAYLEGTSPGTVTALTVTLDTVMTTVTVTSTTGFPSTGTIHVGLECIKYTGTTATTFTGCTRGYLLTSATPHVSGLYVYSFMPSLYRRKAYLYKGYQNLGLDQWARAFGGVIAGAEKTGTMVKFSVMSTTWEGYTDGKRVAFGTSTNAADTPIYGALSLSSDVLSGDFAGITVGASFTTTNLGNGHHLVNVGGHWKAITGVS
jgi:hypothetical protein